MKQLLWTPALLVALAAGTNARAQVPAAPNPNPRPIPGRPPVDRPENPDQTRPRSSASLPIERIYTRVYPYPVPYYPYYPRVNHITLFYSPDPVIVTVPRRRTALDDLADDVLPRKEPPLPPTPAPAEEPAPEPPLPGQPAGVFRPLEPDNRARAMQPVPPEPSGPPEPQAERVPPPQPIPPPAKAPPPPRDDPVAENERLVTLGQEAFARQEYGRAAERWRQATRVAPDQPRAQFLLAQALLALGKYQEAVDAIRAGMALQPDWPTASFKPRSLYGPRDEDFAAHLRRLEETLARHPDEPVLLFLNGYVLWFDGHQDKARPLFRHALTGFADPALIRRFLEARGPAL